MSSYLIKPDEPTILNHKEYHELSSTDLLPSVVVSPRLPNHIPQCCANSWSRGTVLDCLRNSRALGCRKVQRRLGRGIVELPDPRGETSQTWYTRRTMEGMPPLSPPHSSPRINYGMQIRLTNSGVPVRVVDSDADEIFPTDLTTQATFGYTDPLNALGIIYTEGESTEPLFRFTITRFTKLNSTAIGASSSYVLGASSLDLPSSSSCVDENYFS